MWIFNLFEDPSTNINMLCSYATGYDIVIIVFKLVFWMTILFQELSKNTHVFFLNKINNNIEMFVNKA